jgi:hypothetical protein
LFGVLGLVKFGQRLPRLGNDALEVGQCGHAGDRSEHEPEPEDGLHLLFLPDPLGGSYRAAMFDRSTAAGLGNPVVDGCTTKAPCGGQTAGPSPVDRGYDFQAVRDEPVVEFYLALATAIVTLGRLIRQAWSWDRWQTRRRRRP